MTKKEMLLAGLFNPALAISNVLRKIPIGTFEFRIAVDGVERPNYGYALLYAAKQARNLGIKTISAIEFGVAAGKGLIELEKMAEKIKNITQVSIDVFGFDMGTGLPVPVDYRDLPYIFKGGFLKMDTKRLQSKLKNTTRLILGDVADTVPGFMETIFAPVGFVAFDLDYYSSTVHAMKILTSSHERLLPRVYCYFDDTTGSHEELYNEYTGELLAIREFNQQHQYRKVTLINGLIHQRIIKSSWCNSMYALHIFDHPLYNHYVPDQQDYA